MSACDSSPSKFRVVWMAQSQNQLLALKIKAMQCDLEIRSRFAGQLRIIQRAVEYVPLEWGETITEFSNMNLKVCIGFHEGLAINYAVNLGEKGVFVRSICLLSKHFLS
jgi:hypothetical protein